jgi:NifB/MoaA-like Fe-S oxidoreductase
MRKITKSELLKARFEVTKFFNSLSEEDKENCLGALAYAQAPIKDLKEDFIFPGQKESTTRIKYPFLMNNNLNFLRGSFVTLENAFNNMYNIKNKANDN